jgi:crotonobetainyl-CoA:carnitine CoA-transferase CaiB-like acyl-CoA transferase
MEDERFISVRERSINSTELIALLDEVFATRTMDEWEEAFATEPEFFWAPINDLESLLADPAFQSSGAMVEVPDGASSTLMVATPIDFAGTPWEPRSTAPGIGEHTREVLTEMGRSDEEIETLLASGAATEDGSD